MDVDLRNKFGYPIDCNYCEILGDKPNNLSRIDPFHKPGKSIKVLLIGQDPTIFDEPERVDTVLMLNSEGRDGQLRRWLENELFGKENFKKIEIYATNLVKCQFSKPPSTSGGFTFLKPRFEKCRGYLFNEIINFKPTIVISFGEPAHRLFSRELSVLEGKLKFKMKDDFRGNFIKARLNNHIFEYSPCLHIKTFRVAESYGRKVIDFKQKLKDKIS